MFTFARALTADEAAANWQLNADRAALGPVTPAEERAKLAAARAAGAGVLPLAVSPANAATYGCGPWLEVSAFTAFTASTVTLTLHNATAGKAYALYGRTSFSTGAWVFVQNLVAATGQTTATTTLTTTGIPNRFFKVTFTEDYVAAASDGFAGMDETQTSIAPPDTMGSVGPNHIVEMINRMISVYNKTGGSFLESASFYEFFHTADGWPAATDITDPRIFF